jgi:hypothetical protein
MKKQSYLLAVLCVLGVFGTNEQVFANDKNDGPRPCKLEIFTYSVDDDNGNYSYSYVQATTVVFTYDGDGGIKMPLLDAESVTCASNCKKEFPQVQKSMSDKLQEFITAEVCKPHPIIKFHPPG